MIEPTSSVSEQPVAAVPAVRVLFFDHTAALGGGEIALLNLVRHLDSEKVKSIVVLGSDGPLVERLGTQIESYVLPLPSGVADSKKDSLGVATLFRIREITGLVSYIGRLARFIRQSDIDLVHTNSLKADIIGGFAARLARRPVIWHVRDRIDEDYLPRPVVWLFRLLCRIVPTFVVAPSAAALCTVQPKKAQNSAHGSASADTEINARMSVVHDGTIIPRSSAQARKSRALCRVGLIGRISPWKGQHIFLQAAAKVAKRFPDARFVIIGAALFGEQSYDEKVRQLPRELGIENAVEFTGFCEDIHTAIADLDLVVHASTTGEPFGQVIIEGMAAGKPVVATNGGGVPEIVEDGITGTLVPMGDVQAMAEAICAMLADPDRARAMGLRGRQRVEDHFTVALTARKVEKIYHLLLHR
jgi:glycosyltransferase involved in cell wall biosynthesis